MRCFFHNATTPLINLSGGGNVINGEGQANSEDIYHDDNELKSTRFEMSL
jgi:hypothetical protein